MVEPPTVTSTGKEEYMPTSMVEVLGTIWVLRLLYLAMMPMTSSTFSSSTPEMKVVLPAIRKPPVVASLVTEKPSRVRAEDTAPLSSLLTIARISFIVKDTCLFRPAKGVSRPPKACDGPRFSHRGKAPAAWAAGHQAEHGFTLWAVEDKATGSLAGLTGLARVAFDAPFTPCVEIGWRFLPEYWGTGYALEAARSVMGCAFKVLELPEVVAFTTESNLPSQGLTRRLGMLHNPAEDFDHPALPPDHPLHRHVLYRMLKDFWE